MRNIDLHVPPMELFCVWGNAFTPEECAAVKNIGELFEFEKGKIGSGAFAKENEDIRDTDITWIQPKDEFKWVFEKMAALLSKINFDKFQLDLKRFDGFQYSKYKEKGHYDWHTDTIHAPPDGLYRKLSLTLMLTNPEEYEGGEFLINTKGDQDKEVATLKVKMGDLLVFYSHLPHKVVPVTSGCRVTLVTWALGAKLK